MALDQALTSQTLRRALATRAIGSTLQKGPGGPLLLLWVVSAGLLWVLFEQGLWSFLVTGLCAIAGALMVRDHLRNPQVRTHLLRSLLAERFRVEELSREAALRDSVTRGVTYLTEIGVKLLDLTPTRRHDAALLRVLDEADGMVALQGEAAKHVEALQRILRLVPPAGGKTHDTGSTAEAAPAVRLRQEHIAAIDKAVQQARGRSDEINTHLETLVLQVVRLDTRASDVVSTAQCVDAATQTLQRLQMEVNAGREAADELIAWLRHTTPDQTSPGHPVGG